MKLISDLARQKRIMLSTYEMSRLEAIREIRNGSLDAFLEVVPIKDKESKLINNIKLRLIYDGSKDRSNKARVRLESIVRDYRNDWLKQGIEKYKITPNDWKQFELEQNNLASTKQMGAFLIGLLLPVFLVIMILTGCSNPAIDTTAGERERNTWETIMTTASRRINIVVGKYLYVASMGIISGLLNMAALMLTLNVLFSMVLKEKGDLFRFELALESIPIIILGTVLLAFLAAAIMMILASFARTFKDGQSMIGPIFLMMLVPTMFVQRVGNELTPLIASIPVLNILMVIREAINGRFNLPLISLAFVVEGAIIFMCLWLASYILSFENVLIGSYNGSLWRFIRERVKKRKI